MARLKKRITITAKGRDCGKTFEIVEMPVDQGERWANRAILMFMNAGGKLPEGTLEGKGLAGLDISWRSVIVTGVAALQGVSWVQAQPLLDELKHCVTFCPPGAPDITQPLHPGENSQIEEFKTWWTLYIATVELLLGFSLADITSTTAYAPEVPPAS